MKRIAKTLLAAAACLLAAAPVYAGHGGRIGDRLERQKERIEQGIRTGELTKREVRVLKKEQRELRSLAHEFREDGRLDRKERRILARKLDRASENIRDLKHNARARNQREERWERVEWRDRVPHRYHRHYSWY